MNYKLPVAIPEGCKFCFNCKQIKPLEEFHRNASGKHGRHGCCKVCRSPRPKTHSSESVKVTFGEMRQCSMCERILPMAEFPANKSKPEGKDYRCKSCCYRRNEEWRERNREYIRQQAKEKYWAYVRDSEEIKAQVRAKSREYKIKVLTYYGNGTLACVCCGEALLNFLSLDHINNDGAKHRKIMNGSGGRKMYRWLVEHGFPPGYQTLCFNCNLGRQIAGGVCPHQSMVCALIESVG